MPEKIELFDGLLAKIKVILGQCEATAKEQVGNALELAHRIAKTLGDQVNNIHNSIDEFAAKLEKAEENAQVLADRLVLELNLEIAILQAEVQKLLDELKQPANEAVTKAVQETCTEAVQETCKCCCTKPSC